MKIPSACTIDVKGIEPYEVELRMEWIPEEGRLGTRQATYTALPQGESVRLANINKIALGDLLHRSLETAVLGSGGWPGVVARFAEHDQMQVDALVYLLLALGLAYLSLLRLRRARLLRPSCFFWGRLPRIV